MIYLELFERAIQKGRLSHLYLISGKKGSGKKALVKAILNVMLQKEYPNQDLVQRIEEERLSNVFHVRPEGLSIKKEHIIALQNEFSKTSLINGSRIYVIENVEFLTSSAANSLLKFLEEPVGKNTVGFLLTENIDQVLATIVSRSQVLHMPQIEEKETFSYLLSQGVKELDAYIVSHQSQDRDVSFEKTQDPLISSIINEASTVFNLWVNQENGLLHVLDHEGVFLQTKESYPLFIESLLLIFYDYSKYIHDEAYFLKTFEKIYQKLSQNPNSRQIVMEAIESVQHAVYAQNYYLNTELSLLTTIQNIQKIGW